MWFVGYYFMIENTFDIIRIRGSFDFSIQFPWPGKKRNYEFQKKRLKKIILKVITIVSYLLYLWRRGRWRPRSDLRGFEDCPRLAAAALMVLALFSLRIICHTTWEWWGHTRVHQSTSILTSLVLSIIMRCFNKLSTPEIKMLLHKFSSITISGGDNLFELLVWKYL